MSTNQLYNSWYAKMCELRPDEHLGRLKIFSWFLVGLFLSRSVYLGAIAKKIPGRAKRNSTERRLRRLLNNAAIHTRVWYRPVAEHLIESMHAHGLPIRLLVDGSKVGFGRQLLMVAVAYRRRAIRGFPVRVGTVTLGSSWPYWRMCASCCQLRRTSR
ncbi:MAG: hypothetical protein JXR84_19445 [Anaerolineae bacterium]|nr:hypothetical protein [Anaerolineae bacterium]